MSIPYKRKMLLFQKTLLAGAFFVLSLCVVQAPVQAASSSTTALLRQIGSGAPTSYGDYISSSGGLNLPYYFYIEVPAGLTTLTVEIFDADTGRGGGGSLHDWQSGGSWNTSTRYRLFNPSGTGVADVTIGTGTAGTNNAWYTLYTTGTVPAGHWQLVVDMTSAVTSGDDCNGYGIRAHDGNSGAGGTELNIYAHSFVPLGETGAGGTITTTLYPWVTTGCTWDWNDWDGDNGASILCRVSDTSRTGTTSGSYNGSGSTVWLNTPITGYETDRVSADNGIWTTTFTYTDTGAGGNFGVFYLGNSSAANPPPTSQPQANTLRIYLPTDAGGAPLKPFLAQKVSSISGPNPPAAGSTSRLRIEISVFNPSPLAITFSASNLVTANVPGGGVVYAGSAQVTQGSIVSQPAIGGTGDITWNPGSVSGTVPGNSYNYATLLYEIDVTPSTAGQRLPITGTPAANGTRCTFVDETGNTTQARATYNYGPLCELAVTEGGGGPIPTIVAVSSFAARMMDGRQVVEWQTASEVGTAGYYLYRKERDSEEYQIVNPSFLPGLVHSPQGGIYRLVDPTALYGETYTYKLVEVEAGGKTRTYGPFSVTVGSQRADGFAKERAKVKAAMPEPSGVAGYEKLSYAPSALQVSRLQERKMALQQNGDVVRYGQGSAKIGVRKKGIYYLGAAQIAQALGVTQQYAESLILAQRLRLSWQGQDVAWMADRERLGIFFYGERVNSLYTTENIYWLTVGSGLAVEPAGTGAPPLGTADLTFRDTVHAEQGRYALAALFLNPDDDIWMWDYVVVGQEAKQFGIRADGAAGFGEATLTVHVKGATNAPVSPDHYIRVSLNGMWIGGSYWDGLGGHSFSIQFSQSLLRDGENNITVSAAPHPEVPYSIFYVDSFDLEYQRYYRAVNGSLLCRGDGNGVVMVSGFTDAAIMVWDVSLPLQPRVVSGTNIDLANRVTFVPASAESRYLATCSSGILAPTSLKSDVPSHLKQYQNSADYLIIVPAGLKEAAQELASYRLSKGFEPMIVELEDIYDEFNWGIADPRAIREFVAYAYFNWTGKQPKWVVLAGKGTYDYKDWLGFGDNLVPPVLVYTPDGLFASDHWFGDVAGNDAIPEVAVGRLPVLTAQELAVCIRKIKAFEKGSGPWTGNVMLIADNPDESGNYPQASEQFAGLIGGYAIDKIYLYHSYAPDEARWKIIGDFNSGTSLINYVGHAGLDQLAGEDILDLDDLTQIQNGDMLPIMTLISCVVGRFEIPGNLTLCEALLLKDNGGAVAVLGPSGASPASWANLLAEEFFSVVYQEKEKNFGLAWIRAIQRYAASGKDPAILKVYNILGDPAVVFK